MCGVKIAKRGCSSSWTTVLSTSWYVRSIILFCKLLFSLIEYDDFLKKFQETYNSRLGERYEDNPSNHPDFDSDLWMEMGSSGGPEKYRVYRLSNTTAENFRLTHSVSTVGSSPSVLSTSLRSSLPETTISTTLDELWSAPSNGHGDEIKDEWWYMCSSFLAVRSRKQPASSSSSSAAILV